MTLTTRFDMGDPVLIDDTGIAGRVVEIRFVALNLYYKVQYWDEGKIYYVELLENELTLNRDIVIKKCGI